MSAAIDSSARRGNMRAALQAGGTRLAAEHGLAHISVADILSATGVSRRTFYEYFANKHELLASAINPALEAGAAMLEELLDAPPGAVLPGIVECYLQLWEDHGDALIAIAGLNQAIMPLIEQGHRKFGGSMLAALNRAGEAGLLLNDDPQLTFKVISRTAVPLLKIYGAHKNGAELYSRSMLGLLAKLND